MIEIFRIVVIADGMEKLLAYEVFRRFAVARLQRTHEWAAVGFFHSLLEPIGNGVFVNRLNLRIRNRHAQIQTLT